MKYNTLGKTSIKISEIGYGCMSLKNDDATNEQLLNIALDKGINYFDTADIYQDGLNEITVGKAFRQKRKQVVIATKAGNVRRANGGLDWNPSKQHILAAAEKSLERLQTDYIDLYQLHGGTIDDDIDETIEAFELLKVQGKILAYGISSIRPNVIKEYVKRSNISSVMMQYSLLDRRPEESCLQLLQDDKISVLTRGSVAQGVLTGKPVQPYLDYTAQQVKVAADAINHVAGKRKTTVQVALQYVLQHPAVNSAVVGMRTTEQLQDALSVDKAVPLTSKEVLYLQQSLPVNFYTQHR